jgi:hypothetical protein
MMPGSKSMKFELNAKAVIIGVLIIVGISALATAGLVNIDEIKDLARFARDLFMD